MSSWRKKLFILVLLALLVCSIVFWGTAASGCIIIGLILSSQFYVFSHYANKELAKEFQEEGKHVKGWRV